MNTIEHYLKRLNVLKQQLINFMRLKNINVEDDENFNTLIPKLETLTRVDTSTSNLTYYSLIGCPLSDEEIHTLIKQLPYVTFGVPVSATNDARNCDMLFYNATNLTNLALNEELGITKINSWTDMLKGTNIKNLSLENIESAVTIDKIGAATGSGTTAVTSIERINLSNAKLPSLTFAYWKNLKEIIGLDSITFTNSVNGCSNYYINCETLEEASLSHVPFNTAQGSYSASGVFSNCKSLEKAIAHLPGNISNMQNFCSNCTSLTELDVSMERTDDVLVTMQNFMKNCSSMVTADLSNIKCKVATTLTDFVSGCTLLETLDISNIEVPDNVTFTNFALNCPNLKEIKFNKTVLKPNKLDYMFKNCNVTQELLDSIHFNEWDLTNLSSMYEFMAKPVDKTYTDEKVFDVCYIPANLTELDYLNFKNAKDSNGNFVGPGYILENYLLDTCDISNTYCKPTGYYGLITKAPSTTHTPDKSSKSLIRHLICNDTTYFVHYNYTSIIVDALFNGQVFLETVEANNFNIILQNTSVNISHGLSKCMSLKSLDMSTWTIGYNDGVVRAMDFSSFAYQCGLETFGGFSHVVKISNATRFIAKCPNLHTIDLSKYDLSECSNMTESFTELPKLVNVVFFTNWGKFFAGNQSNVSQYQVNFTSSPLLSIDSLKDILNKVYDLNITYGVYDEEGNPGTGTLRTQKLILGETNLAKLTSEDIAIATSKGWTVS